MLWILCTLLAFGVAAVCSVPPGVPDAGPYIQACINNAPVGATVQLQPGLYRIGTGLTIAKSLTLTTIGAPAPCSPNSPFCATLQATPAMYQVGGIILVSAPGGVHLDHIIIDGNRAARLSSRAASECSTGANNRYAGLNALITGCTGCSFTNSVTMNSLCASGMVVAGAGFQVVLSTINNNGDHFTQNMWSDGLTLTNCPGLIVDSCQFSDNTDVDLIMGNGPVTVTNNYVRHTACCPSFAAMMLDNFDSSTPGIFVGSMITANHILCAGHCCFGIEVGPHPWYQSQNIAGGNVTGNEIMGAGVLINVDGAGTPANPTIIGPNDLRGAMGSFSCAPLCGNRNQPGSFLNISPKSIVSTFGTQPAPTRRNYCV